MQLKNLHVNEPSFNWTIRSAVLAELVGALDLGSFVWKDAGVPNCSVWDGSQWRDSVSLARVDPALNGYLGEIWGR